MPRSAAILLLPLLATVTALASPPPADEPRAAPPAEVPDDPRFGLLTPLPETGGVPPIVSMLGAPSEAELAARAARREYVRQIRAICREHLGRIRVERVRDEGLERLREFTDPAAFQPLLEQTRREQDDVRTAVLDHLAEQGEPGQAALAWAAIHEAAAAPDRETQLAVRHEATRRMTSPAGPAVLRVLDRALRSPTHEIANNAGALAGALGAAETIPLLILAQATSDPVTQQGDLAWIAIQTQTAYVQNLQPIAGDASGAFAPVLGVVNEGVVLRVVDAVAVTYRTEIHDSLVAMTTSEMGESTAHLGYDLPAWYRWYNARFVPHMREKQRIAELAGEPPPAP